mmetsp:Transcript_27387/g.77455  ORF Transcript_27387/g.77455 Transcript_27387/m.77455 type:complete len:219 (+) Transcript_27387:26-682(+)
MSAGAALNQRQSSRLCSTPSEVHLSRKKRVRRSSSGQHEVSGPGFKASAISASKTDLLGASSRTPPLMREMSLPESGLTRRAASIRAPLGVTGPASGAALTSTPAGTGSSKSWSSDLRTRRSASRNRSLSKSSCSNARSLRKIRRISGAAAPYVREGSAATSSTRRSSKSSASTSKKCFGTSSVCKSTRACRDHFRSALPSTARPRKSSVRPPYMSAA